MTEYFEIEVELEQLETQIYELLNKQSTLLERKKLLELGRDNAGGFSTPDRGANHGEFNQQTQWNSLRERNQRIDV